MLAFRTPNFCLKQKNSKNSTFFFPNGGELRIMVFTELTIDNNHVKLQKMGSSSAFLVICMLHSAIAMTSGALMMFYMKEAYTFGHGVQTATKLLGSTPHDQLLIKTSDSFSGLLLLTIGFLLWMVSFVKDRDFQAFFAKGCTLLHVFMAVWRVSFERKVEDLAWDWLRQTVGDALLALSWVFFLVYSWREKYD